jgi:hypothetical protein
VKAFWTDKFGAWNPKQKAEYRAPLQNKIGALVSNPAMRNVIGQDRGLDLSWLMNNGKVLICNLSKGRLGEETSNLLGALITSGFAQAAQERAPMPEEQRRDFTLVIDEFQNFTTTAFAAILSEARKYRLSLVVAHQFMSQIPDFLQDAVIGTANTTVAFRCGATDARLLGKELDLDNHRRVKNLPNHHALARTVEGGMPGNTHEIATDPPRRPGKRLGAVRRHTKQFYGESRDVVERNIERPLG